ncbi:response regulator [Nitrospirota bacterium]
MRRKILIVEDEMLAALYLKTTILDLGYDVLDIAPSGEKAVEISRGRKPDMVFMDIRLAGEIDGIEAAKEILKIHSVPLVFLSAYSDDKTIKSAQAINHAGFYEKPINEYQLKAILNAAFESAT